MESATLITGGTSMNGVVPTRLEKDGANLPHERATFMGGHADSRGLAGDCFSYSV